MAEYTTKLQQHKIDAINDLKDMFQNTEDFIITDYRGLNVEQITELREKLRETGATYRVVKNRYVKIALSDLEMPEISDKLMGPTALALTQGETGPAAKVLVDFTGVTSLQLKGALIDGQVFDQAQVEAFSKLPTKLELIAQLMSAMNGAVTNLMYVLKAVPQKLVRTLQAVADQKAEGHIEKPTVNS